jgi:hypothetical protein
MKNRVTLLIASVVAVTALACGDGDDAANGDGSGASSGQGGSGGSSPGGSGGQAATGGGGSSGGETGGGSGGSGGSSGTGGGDDVLNPDLPPPSYDCRTDSQSRQCVSIRGTIAGRTVDRHCALPDSPTAFVGTNPAWVTSCEQQEGDQAYLYRVDVPVQDVGAFHHMLDPENYTGADIVASVNDVGGDGRADNLILAELAGSVVRDPQTTDDIITGTFRATWRDPQSSCFPAYVDECAAADVHGTFRMIYSLKVGDLP